MIETGGKIIEVIVATLIIASMLSLLELPWLTKKERRITAYFRISVFSIAGFLWFSYHNPVASSMVDGVGKNLANITQMISGLIRQLGLLLGGGV